MFRPLAESLVLCVLYTHTKAGLIAPPGPTPPSYNEIGGHGWTPRPTQAPVAARGNLGAMNQRDLFARQQDPALCGYVNNIMTDSITCAFGYACGYYTDPNYAVCCATDIAGSFTGYCPAATTCEDYLGVYQYSTSTTSDGAVWCPAAYPNCLTWVFNGKNTADSLTYLGYVCTDLTGDLIFDVYPTADEASAAASTTPITTTLPSIITRSAGGSVATSSVSTTPGTTTLPADSGQDTPTYTPPPVEPTSHPSNAGAIAGGVIGGLAAVAAVVGGILYMIRRKRNQHKEFVPEVSQVNTN